ncbi:putative C6 transcription factor [Rosellinia necatrix]|uniref:Putative C6 transcription factor n=1 Tax=Rosellinia necatrix TaxID=77044 RepID=A0A1S8A8T9_ROSNE|nr:putative C6 transcription factor [Rosellinia necatrix]
MADARQETQLAIQPSRIKRNTACTSCRDAKVRCNPSSNADQPCQRCAKLDLTCVVDRTHKRVSRRSKLDELVQEIQSIKESVGSASSANVPPPTPVAARPKGLATEQLCVLSPGGVSSRSRQHVTTGPAAIGVAEPSVALNTPVTTLLSEASNEPSLPRTLGSYPFSGDDIDFYFQKYFECYHPYMPVVRERDPNKCYEICHLLFWTIIYVASRRYAKSASLVPFLSEEIRRQAFATLGDIPLSLPTINAIILICSWNFPAARFTNDPAVLLSNAVVSAALLLGIHTGRGGHPEYSHGLFQNSYTDEAATYTWAGLNIVSQRYHQLPVTCVVN